MKPQPLILCTRNQHKVLEIKAISKLPIQWLSLEDVGYNLPLEEPFETLEENARTKAMQVYQVLKKACLSEDSGLFVEALQGAPGVYSARYAGDGQSAEANIRKLLFEMQGVENRNACFRTIICWMDETGMERQFSGECPGEIALEAKGHGGFGYDPVFIPLGYRQVFAELDPRIKLDISHRSKAFDAFQQAYQEVYQNH